MVQVRQRPGDLEAISALAARVNRSLDLELVL
jgi:hypothetical protein